MEQNKNFGKVLLGAAVILIGSLLLMDNLDLVSFPWTSYLLSWKSILIFVGVVFLATQRNITTGIILTSLGVVFWLPELLDHQIRLSQVLWPAVLITVGLVVIFNSRKQRSPGGHAVAGDGEPKVTVLGDTETK